MTLALIVDWYGPFGSISALQARMDEWGPSEVLYFATGKRSHQRATDLQYVGISLDAKVRFNDLDHKIATFIKKEHAIWVGYVVSHGIAGRRAAHHPTKHSVAVEQAEWMLAYLLALPLNVKKRDKPPKESAILVNRWFNEATEERRVHRGHDEWPDYIEYDEEAGTAAMVWFGGKRRRLSSAAVEALRHKHRLEAVEDDEGA